MHPDYLVCQTFFDSFFHDGRVFYTEADGLKDTSVKVRQSINLSIQYGHEILPELELFLDAL